MEDLIDPSYEDDDTDYHPSALAQSVMGAVICITIILAFVGAASILQSIAQGLQ